MDVGGAAVDGAQDQRVDETHDRALGRQRREVYDVALVVGDELQPQRLAGLLEQQLAAAVSLQDLVDAAAGGDDGVDRPPELELQLVDLQQVVETAEGQHEP